MQTVRVVPPDGVATVLRHNGRTGAPGIILIHGILHCSLVWKHQFADPALDGFHLAAYDIRGHGAADKPSAAEFYQPGRFADELHTVIRASGMDRPVLVGWSLGTRMTFNYFEKYGAGEAGGFVIAGARSKVAPTAGGIGQPAILRSCAEDLQERVEARLAFVQACYGVPPAPGDLAEIGACAMLVPPEVLRHFAGRPMDYDAVLAQLPVPVRVLQGARDPVCPLHEARRITQVNPSAHLTVYPELGHAPFFEDPPRFDRDLAEFVNACARPARS